MLNQESGLRLVHGQKWSWFELSPFQANDDPFQVVKFLQPNQQNYPVMYQPMPPPAMPYYPYAYPPPPSHPYHDYQQPVRQVESAVDHRIHEIPDESNKPRRSIQRRPPLKKSTTPATLPDVTGLLRFTMKLFYFKINVLLRRLFL